ncbi:PAS domain S-box protein [candidate division KSB1 bacterium]
MKKPTYEELEKLLKKLKDDSTDRKDMERSLQYFRKAVDSSSDAIGMSTPDGRHYYQNEAFDRMFGMSVEKVDGESGPPATIYADEKVGREVFKTIMSGNTWIGEVEMLDRNQNIISVFLRAYAIKDEDENVIGLVGVHTDISEEKKVNELLRSSEKKYRKLYEGLRDASASIDMNGKFTDFNTVFQKMLGYRKNEIFKLNFKNITPEKWHAKEERILKEQVMVKGYSRVYEKEYIRKDGTVFPVELRTYLIRDDNGNPSGIWTLVRDITQQRRAEEKMNEAYGLLQETQRIAKLGGWEYDVINNKVTWTDEVYRIYGVDKNFDQNDLDKVAGFFNSDDRDVLREAFNKAIEEGEPYDLEFRFKNAKGKDLWVRSEGSPEIIDGKIVRIKGNFQDITERKMSEIKMVDEIEFNETVINTLNDTFFVFDPSTGKAIRWNKYFTRISGYSDDEIASMKAPDSWYSEEDLKKASAATEKVFEEGQATVEISLITKSGEKIPTEYSVSMISGEDGNPKYIISVGRDMRERKEAEKAFRESEQRYKLLFDNMTAGVAVYEAVGGGKDFVFRSINSAGERICQLSRDKIIGNKVSETFSGVKEMGLFDIFKRVYKTGNPENLQLSEYSDDVLNIWVENYVFRLPSGEIVAMFDDITEKKKVEIDKNKLEEQLIHSQKMESIGRLAGGIAHDFNNILVGIMGYSELLKLKFPETNSTVGEAANIILQGAERAADLTKQLLGFARGGKYNPVPLNINREIEDTMKVSEKIFEKNIKIEFDFNESIDPINADRNQINQVLTNLMINAKDAMPNGGELIFKTENVNVEKNYVKIFPEFLPGNYVKISVTDTGTGMTKDIKDHIFEPFFTTKGEGKGTGLGLATVYGIIKNHDGHINTYSEPGEGTTFNIYLPATEKKAVERKEKNNVIKGDATILVVDDEENVRKLARRMLKSLGYKVIISKDGKDAERVFRKRHKDIDLVLLDMIMPEQAGRETNLALRKMDPNVKVILSSGYSQNGKATQILNEGVLGFIQKPYRLEELSKIVAETLSEDK